ncbi:hypothetical protein Hypma_001806 [Hypsizygus marmoreus]|uniref:G domain-containing protein n=1 Tax=Hypsizygus marmoreus TaxID=39966 RepID=A0A369J975_HYPMA|nr:hypothetical protein Hypma_001806 [Hypsizygus marmoreus]
MGAPPSLKIRDCDVIILILGQTGAGKSTFINSAIGRDLAEVGHNLGSHTSKIQPYAMTSRPSYPHRRIVLIDTPGFNDTWASDHKILNDIQDWFERSCKSSTQFAGILYLHEISQDRLPPESNYMSPTQLSKPETASNLVVATVKWEEVHQQKGEKNEALLKEHLKEMCDRGTQIVRFTRTTESACDVVDLMLRGKYTTVDFIQSELSRILPHDSFGDHRKVRHLGFLSTLFGRLLG